VTDSAPDELRGVAARSTVRLPLAGAGRPHGDEFGVHMTPNSSASGLELLVDSAQLTDVLAKLLGIFGGKEPNGAAGAAERDQQACDRRADEVADVLGPARERV
jgi:hypothetical protein